MKLYSAKHRVKIIEMTVPQIVETINQDFPCKCTVNHDGNFDVSFNKRRSDSEYVSESFLELIDQFPELYLHHAYDGLSGSSFEFALRDA